MKSRVGEGSPRTAHSTAMVLTSSHGVSKLVYIWFQYLTRLLTSSLKESLDMDLNIGIVSKVPTKLFDFDL